VVVPKLCIRVHELKIAAHLNSETIRPHRA
jgi:hypothetical protein